jgi:pantoate--beta-alanine ligase
VMRTQPALAVDYVAVVEPGTFGPVTGGPAVLIAAARVGGTRLIDNVPVLLPAGAATEGPAGHAAHH